MAKRRKKKERKSKKRGFSDRFRRPSADLSSTFEKVDRLVETGRAVLVCILAWGVNLAVGVVLFGMCATGAAIAV